MAKIKDYESRKHIFELYTPEELETEKSSCAELVDGIHNSPLFRHMEPEVREDVQIIDDIQQARKEK